MSSTSFATRKPVTVERTIGGKTLSLETGRLAKQASGAVVVRLGDTMTLVAAVAGPGREGLDFFPLTVDYREKAYAAGKFPGGFIKREGRPTTKEILTSRLIDRPIRPLFPDRLPRRSPDPGRAHLGRPRERPRRPLDDRRLGLAAAGPTSRSSGPIGAVRLGRIDGGFVLFPTADELEESDLDLVVASTDAGHRHDRGLRPGDARSRDARGDHGGPPAQSGAHRAPARAASPPLGLPPIHEARRGPRPAPPDDLRPLRPRAPRAQADPAARPSATTRSRTCSRRDHRRVLPRRARRARPPPLQVKAAFHAVEEQVVREMILDGNRIDGRGPRDLRPISLRGRRPARARTARRSSSAARRRRSSPPCSAPAADEQRVDGLMDEYSKKFMLDYNIPAVLRRRGPADPRPGPPRDRPRRPGRALVCSRSSPARRSSPTRSASSRDILESNGSSSHGLGLRRHARADGRRRADQRPGRRHLDRPGQGRGDRPARPADRHHGRRGPLRRHGLQGRRHRSAASPASSSTSRSTASTSEIIRETLDQAREARLEILKTMLRAIKRPARGDLAPTPRG